MNLFRKRTVLVPVLFCAAAAVSSADTFGMDSKVGILVDFVTSPWVSGIAFIALVIECIALLTAGRQEPQMFKKFIPWIIGTIVFMAAGPITKAFLTLDDDYKTSVKTDLGIDN